MSGADKFVVCELRSPALAASAPLRVLLTRPPWKQTTTEEEEGALPVLGLSLAQILTDALDATTGPAR